MDQSPDRPVTIPHPRPHPPVMEESTSSLFDWGELLEFTYDDQFISPFESLPPSDSPVLPPLPTDRIRKRDPRLVCENFLAGRVPCACPEIDEKLAELEEEEAGGPGKKRARTGRVGLGKARCQVPGCEVDISELKGYHKRHRVCLGCATASSVLIDGQSRRYCQQCGKFHILSDFDEGKRSCRRKLERHNDRRRRKHTSPKGSAEKETQENLLGDDISCDIEAGKGTDDLSLSNQSAEKEELLESENGNISNLCSAPNSHIVHTDSVVSFGASDGGKDGSKCGLLSPFSENKNTYSSVCPTGRISFKLYDWNPAEFPRRLRHQIFQWLASMPVELEGYIRPGCTILTVFVAMPKFMWVKIFEDPVSYLNDFVAAPGRPLSGKGTDLVYLNNMLFKMVKDRNSIMKVNLKVQPPRLHYVHPTCFEAGKAMEFVACGSYLLQPKFRFLISFAGKYLAHESYVSLAHDESERDSSYLDHQSYKIYVSCTESTYLGPAFIEVENESGLSNFIPILIGDKEICSEMEIMQQRHGLSLLSKRSEFIADLSELPVMRQAPLSQFILDIGWLLKEPALETIFTSSQIRRYSYMLDFLICCDSTIILERILKSLKGVMIKAQMSSLVSGITDGDIRLFQKNLDHADKVLHQRRLGLGLQSPCFVAKDNSLSQSCPQDDMFSVIPSCNEDMETGVNWRFHLVPESISPDGSDTIPLLDGEVIKQNHINKLSNKSCNRISSSTGIVCSSRPTVFLFAVAIVCFGVCAVFFHPGKVSHFAVTIRRCLFD